MLSKRETRALGGGVLELWDLVFGMKRTCGGYIGRFEEQSICVPCQDIPKGRTQDHASEVPPPLAPTPGASTPLHERPTPQARKKQDAVTTPHADGAVGKLRHAHPVGSSSYCSAPSHPRCTMRCACVSLRFGQANSGINLYVVGMCLSSFAKCP